MVERVKCFCFLISPFSLVPRTKCQSAITSLKQNVWRMVHSDTTIFCCRSLRLPWPWWEHAWFFKKKKKSLTLKNYNKFLSVLFMFSTSVIVCKLIWLSRIVHQFTRSNKYIYIYFLFVMG